MIVASKIQNDFKYTLLYPSFVKAAVFDNHGLDNLRITDFPIPTIGKGDVLIKVIQVGVNPIDYFTVSGYHGLNSSFPLQPHPFPHIPGSEICGEIIKIDDSVKGFKIGDRVIVYNRIFDGICDMCLSGNQMLCRKGGLVGVTTNGGFAEYFCINYRNILKIPDSLDWDLATSLPISALTSFHGLNISSFQINEFLIVFGASGNTGIFASQFGKKMGGKVIGISNKKWIKSYGVDYQLKYDELEKIKEITDNKMADVVIDSLGSNLAEQGLYLLGNNGRFVTFGILTGPIININFLHVYSKQIKLIGSTGGTIVELEEILNNCDDLKVKVWKKFSIDESTKALNSLFDKTREGRIIIKFS